jgi:8-oxo-dGTP diphosphatase
VKFTLARSLTWLQHGRRVFATAGTRGTVYGLSQELPKRFVPSPEEAPEVLLAVGLDAVYVTDPQAKMEEMRAHEGWRTTLRPADVVTDREGPSEPSQRYVVGFLFYGAEVALVRKAKPAWQCGHLNGVGGKIERRESPAEAMAREFREETGVATEPSDWTEAVVMDGPGWRIHFFSRESGWRPVLVGSEEEPVAWYPVYPLPVHVLPNLRWLIPLVRDKDLDFPVHVRDHTHPVEA